MSHVWGVSSRSCLSDVNQSVRLTHQGLTYREACAVARAIRAAGGLAWVGRCA